jgi:hypothetical protein
MFGPLPRYGRWLNEGGRFRRKFLFGQQLEIGFRGHI